MLGGQSTLDWQVGESEDWDDFEPLEVLSRVETTTSDQTATDRRWHLGRVLRGLTLVVVLAVIIVGYSSWREYQADIFRIKTDIQGTIDVEAWAWESSDETLIDSLIDGQANEGWTRQFRRDQDRRRHWAGDDARAPVVQIEKVELQGDLALIEVLVTEPGVPWTSTPYRETRFYRQVEGRWLRTAPQSDFWGVERTLETDHFRFEFHQRDAEAVKAVAADADTLYSKLRQDVGLGPPPADEKLTIEIIPRTNVVDWRFAGDKLTVSSPALLPVPEGLPDAARLTQSITYPLTRRVVGEALEDVEINTEWRPVVEGARHWLSWDRSSLPSGWRYHAEEPLRKQLEQGTSLRLADLTHSKSERWDRSGRWTQLIAAETMVAYAMDTYGPEMLRALVRGLGEHETWDTLIPAVFDVSARDFEAGWQAYLVARYERPAKDMQITGG
ncbi:MAG: hypothetical protein ACE5LU_19250 [Anaerolineae bacterium]